METSSKGLVISGSITNENVSKFVKEIFEWGSSLFFAFSICFFITVFTMNFTVSGDSMLPTLHNGDRLLINKFMYVPVNGDIVTIDEEDSLEKNIVKRVIATPGDTFKIDYTKHEIFVNGKLLQEDYIYEPTAYRADEFFENNVLYTVPENHVIVLGDNRNHSHDSRTSDVGFVNIKKLYGRAFVICWPLDRLRLF